ncbi:hypothetical protein ABZ802_23355 [Streptomyces sp. NPDC047737]|uniref:hypothetical protein n=1 Tax=unclassified Streptomyces TaxID=2593676 RepID=UPI0033CF2F95
MTAETASPAEISTPTGPVRLSATARTALRPVGRARITGGFWAGRRRTNADVSIPQGPRRFWRRWTGRGGWTRCSSTRTPLSKRSTAPDSSAASRW